MRPLRVVGLDLSLTSTGMSDTRAHLAVQTDPVDGCTEERMSNVLHQVRYFTLGYSSKWLAADLVVLEGAAYGARGDAVDQLAGLRWLVRCALWRLEVPVAVVTPTGLKKYTTGSGRAGKAQMVAGVRERYGHDFSHVRIKDGRYDMADAFALAAMGLAAKGRSLALDGQPERNENLRAVNWPALLSDD